jgi:hypothetical protein
MLRCRWSASLRTDLGVNALPSAGGAGDGRLNDEVLVVAGAGGDGLPPFESPGMPDRSRAARDDAGQWLV